MRIYAQTRGDDRSGITSQYLIVNIPSMKINDVYGDQREEIKDSLKNFVTEITEDGSVFVWMEDECPDCGERLSKGIGVCRNPKCQLMVELGNSGE